MWHHGDHGEAVIPLAVAANPKPKPIGSMYGIYANIWGILMVNVTILYHIYSIHGSYGYHKIEQTGIPKQQK
jgi:hypothetical protein